MNDAMTDDVITIDNYMEQPVVLDVSHVDKWFKLPTEQASGLKQAFINWTRRASKATRSSMCCAMCLSSASGRVLRHCGPQWRWQVDAAQDHLADLLSEPGFGGC